MECATVFGNRLSLQKALTQLDSPSPP